MACISPDGTLTSSGVAMLSALKAPITLEEVAQVAGLPLFRVRSGVREMIAGGMVEEAGGKYSLTELGKQQLGT